MCKSGTEKIAEGIYWVGGIEHSEGLHCNPYLIIDEEEAVLIDPGSVLDFEEVLKNVSSIVSLDKIKYVILHHQDPDFCSSVPFFEKAGANFKIIAHWRTQSLVKYYGVKSDFYIVNENNYKLVLQSGRVLRFIQTPYLHFPGSIVTFDSKTKTLFSSDLFGAFSYRWNLYASDDYIEKMKAFHEHYMPSNDIMRPVMEVFLKMNIERIAPQHGSIIKYKVKEHIKALRDLECGAFLAPIKKDLLKSGGYIYICNEILKRYASVFSKEEIFELIEKMDIEYDKENMEILDYNYRGPVFWDELFENVFANKGLQWLIVIEPLVKKLTKEYDIPIPKVFNSAIFKVQEKAAEVSNENKMLREINERLNGSIKETQEKMTKCSVTGLYNYDFFKSYLSSNITDIIKNSSLLNPAVIIINVDNMSDIEIKYGRDEVIEILKNLVYIIDSEKKDNTLTFRLQEYSFACYIPHITKKEAISFAEKLKNEIAGSKKFIENLLVSVGVASFEEIKYSIDNLEDVAEYFYNLATRRSYLARKSGKNMVGSAFIDEKLLLNVGKILIVDTDDAHIDVLKTFLENINYEVLIAKNGEDAINICEGELPDLVVSEVMLPKIDGFGVRRELLSKSQTKSIPFILVSYLKNEETIANATELEIEHYFKKPYFVSELVGLIKNKVKGDAYQ